MLTVLFATKNRARILNDVLESFCRLLSPSCGWKLVVVDNGSTDNTLSVLNSFSSRLPLTVVTEPTAGKNAALNAGLATVEGDLTVFTDDDAFPCRDWLVRLRVAADDQPEYSMFGGAVVPRWEVPPPPWIHWVEVAAAFGMNDPSLKDGPLPPSRIPDIIGPNMAIRSNIFYSGVRFDSSIGPSGLNYSMGSETELVLRLNRQGHKGWHVHAATVEHLVRQEQLDKEWILRRAIRFGRGHHRLFPNPKLWLGVPRHLFRDIPKEGFRVAVAWGSLRPDCLFRSRWRFNYFLGVAIEARSMSRHSASQVGCEAASQDT
jgi:glycosyltransferase involved in cell wall biosynthesis